MARKPQQKRAKVTVETIIEAGFISVAQSGIEGTTTRQIAEIAGIGVGSLYEYFTNKEDIYDAMSQHFVNEVLKMQVSRAQAKGLKVRLEIAGGMPDQVLADPLLQVVDWDGDDLFVQASLILHEECPHGTATDDTAGDH